MVTRLTGVVNRALYGAIFVAGVPALLVVWARLTADVVPLRSVHSIPGGAALMALGFLFITAGMYELIVHGRGLPMNAFPPAEFVSTGIYRFVANPIYLGFGLCCFGVAIATGSASGLWLVSPIAGVAAAALVIGYERPDLRRRFGAHASAPPLLSLPRNADKPATAWQRAAVVVYVLLPWLIVYYAVQALGRAPDAFTVDWPFERRLPVIEWTEALYVSAYAFVPLTPFVVRPQYALRRFAVIGALATAIVTTVWIVVPVVASHRPFDATTWLGRLLSFEREFSARVAAFPAFHVLWALIAADAWQVNARVTGRRIWARVGWTWAAAIIVSCVTTGMHAVADLAAAALLFLLLRRFADVWVARPAALGVLAGTLVAALLVRIWWLGGPSGLIAGLILIFIGLAGFVTGPRHARSPTRRLRPHQWLAIASVVAGVLVTSWA